MKTLIECFETNGKKFPLNVKWYINGINNNPIDLTFINLKFRNDEPTVQTFVPDSFSRYNLLSDEGHDIGGFANEQLYELKDNRITNKPKWF